MTRELWLFSKRYDLMWLYAPVWLCWLVAFSLPADFVNIETPTWVWVVFIIGIDVSHVWSTIFRTYLDKEEFSNHRKLLMTAPVIGFISAWVLAQYSTFLFWRILAYVAVFHFAKQQYGFMRIYKAKARDFKKQWISDNFIIYLSMGYPIIFWHFKPNRRFSWFIEDDFLMSGFAGGNSLFFWCSLLYFLVLMVWLAQELIIKEKAATGKILWVLTTAANWYIGIVHFNSDLIFTITNVVAHGVPYMALVIFYQHKKLSLKGATAKGRVIVRCMIVSILMLAFMEEYLWDALVNHDYTPFFQSIAPSLASFELSANWQATATALLAVPQITHYVVDGFIWKTGHKNPYMKRVFFTKTNCP